jgi:hypothetical protein
MAICLMSQGMHVESPITPAPKQHITTAAAASA